MIDTREIQIVEYSFDQHKLLEENISLKKTNRSLKGLAIIGIIIFAIAAAYIKISAERKNTRPTD